MGGIRCSDSAMAEPLTNRRKRDGSLYERPIAIESAVDALLVYPRATILARLEVRNTRNAEYIPSEAVMHLLRETRADNDLSLIHI